MAILFAPRLRGADGGHHARQHIGRFEMGITLVPPWARAS
jgi:hypothetical protein